MPGTSNRRSTSVGANTSPTSRVTSPVYGLNTRRTIRSTATQESIEMQANKITQMSSTTPAPVIAATRAVAFILKDHVASEIANMVAKQVTDSVTAKLVDHVVAAISPQVALVYNTSQSLTTTLEDATSLHNSIGRERTEKEEGIKTAADRIEEAADALYESVETYQKALQILTPSLDATQEKIDMLATQITKVPTQQPMAMPSYSVAVTANLDLNINKAVSRAAIRARQILLDPKPGSTLFPINTPTIEIAKKLNEALDKAREESTPQGKIKAVTSAILETTTRESAGEKAWECARVLREARESAHVFAETGRLSAVMRSRSATE
ncbi:hypothetical protein EV424DRAFT_1561309 [Suillus variegatus]|nr:hypothetical protein EV424DRAFT_1561309 [Suillus variegatus]